MNSWVMIDTSAWTHALRRNGDPVIRSRVERLLNDRTAAWCEMVRLELWSGVRNDMERAALSRLDLTRGSSLRIVGAVEVEIWSNKTRR